MHVKILLVVKLHVFYIKCSISRVFYGIITGINISTRIARAINLPVDSHSTVLITYTYTPLYCAQTLCGLVLQNLCLASCKKLAKKGVRAANPQDRLLPGAWERQRYESCFLLDGVMAC